MSHHTLAEVVTPGTRLTWQRQVIWNTLHQSEEHLSAEAIRDRIASALPSANLPTIYRNLATLKEMGLIQELHIADSPVRFEAIVHSLEHPHLVCRDCGHVEHPEARALSAAVKAAALASGFGQPSAGVIVYGACQACLGASVLRAADHG
ncbi:MAG: transcriptional repressor [Chloroflexi bacterium]|nr:transcriptional repressor [Chloroflexota bacterium]